MFTEEVIQNPANEKDIDEIINTAKSDCEKMTIYNQNSKSQIKQTFSLIKQTSFPFSEILMNPSIKLLSTTRI